MGARSVLESFVVELGIDVDKLSAQQRETIDKFDRMKESTRKTGEEVEKRSILAAEGLNKLGRAAISLFAIFTAGRGIKDFAQGITLFNANLGFTASRLDMSAEKLGEWQLAAKSVGGTAEATTASLSGFISDLQQYSLTGQSAVAPWLRGLLPEGFKLFDERGVIRVQAILEQISAKVQGMPRSRATAWLQNLGFDPALITLLEQGPTELRRRLAEMQPLVAKDKDTAAAEKLQESFTKLEGSSARLGVTLMTRLQPWLDKLAAWLDELAAWLQQHPDVLDAIAAGLIGLAAAIGVIGIAALGISGTAALVAAGIGGIIAGGVYLVEHWDAVSRWANTQWKNFWDHLKDGPSGWLAWIKQYGRYILPIVENPSLIGFGQAVSNYVNDAINHRGVFFGPGSGGPGSEGAKPEAPTSPVGPRRALLDTIAGRGAENAGYNTLFGGGKFSDFSKFPSWAGAWAGHGPTHAAGRYQFEPATWARAAKALGLKDFSPESQDKAAWWLAEQAYGSSLAADLASGDPMKLSAIAHALASTWSSLPSGLEARMTDDQFVRSILRRLHPPSAQRSPVGAHASSSGGRSSAPAANVDNSKKVHIGTINVDASSARDSADVWKHIGRAEDSFVATQANAGPS